MRDINRSAVIEYLRFVKTASRTQIAQQLNISKPTVMRIIDPLLEAGFVCSTGKKESGKGRYRELLSLNTDGNLVIGIDIGGSHISGAITNIGGDIVHKIRIDVEWRTPDENFDLLVNFIHRVIDFPRNQKSNLLGLAIGVPGIVEKQSGKVKLAPSLEWQDFPLLNRLNNIFDLQISVENDVNLAVLGEHWFGGGVGTENLIMIAIGTGIGAGIILDGKLYRGFQESSGEIGYIIPGIHFLDNQYPGFGALESIASGKGIAHRGMQRLLGLNLDTQIDKIDAAFVFQAARDNEEWAVQIISESIDYLSLAIANVSVCFDPELIILGGGVSKACDLLIEPIKDRIKGVIPWVPHIECSNLKEKAVLLGAVVRVFQNFADYVVVHNG